MCFTLKPCSEAPPADGFGRWPHPRGVAVRKGGVAQQRAPGRAAQHAQTLQLGPPALHQVLLRVLGVRQRRVEENQQVVSQHGAAHVATVGAAVAGDALVQSAHTHNTHALIFRIQHSFSAASAS